MQPARSQSSYRTFLVAVALAATLAPLNSTMITVALPVLGQDFGAAVADTSWLVIAYLVTMASAQPIAGKLGDRWGRRRLVLGGLVYFGLASVGAALAPTLLVLIVFRVQQAVGIAVALPNGTALIREVVPAARRARSFGTIGAIASLAAAAGPAIGGLLVGFAGWRTIFAVNLVIIAPALVLGWRAIPVAHRRRRRAAFDLAGALLLLAVLGGTVRLLTLSRGAGDTRFLLPAVALVALVVLAAVTFVFRELRHPDPVVQLRLFGRRTFAAACGAIAFSNLAMYNTLLTVPMLLAARGGWSAAQIGMVLTVLAAASVICAPLGGRLADRYGRRWPTVGGLALSAIGVLALALGGRDVSLPLLVASLGLLGVGLGIASAGMQTAAVEAVDADQAGLAAGLFSTSRYLGSVVGASLLAVLLVTGTAGVSGFDQAFTLVAAAAAVAVAMALGLHDRPASNT